MYVISLCDKSGVMVKPWADAGFKCWCVDTQHSIRKDRVEGNVSFVWGDVRSWCPPEEARRRIVAVFAFPPCTDVTGADARDFRKKRNILLRDALELFSACEMVACWSGAPYMIENPVGKFSDHMGKPDFTFQPWQFGDLYSKKTCLWTGNGFVMPSPIHAVEPDGVTQKIWTMPPSAERANLRSQTPAGFAQAVFEANVDMVRQRSLVA